VLKELSGRFALRDNEHNELIADRLLQPAFCLRAGKRYDAVASILPRAVAA
jgi:dihydroorotase